MGQQILRSGSFKGVQLEITSKWCTDWCWYWFGFWFRSVVERSIAKPDDDAAVGFCLRQVRWIRELN